MTRNGSRRKARSWPRRALETRSAMSRLAFVLTLALLAACTAPPPPRPASTPAAEARADAAQVAAAPEPVEAGEIAVTSADATWGDAQAPVTIVMFADFECRHCGSAARTIEVL